MTKEEVFKKLDSMTDFIADILAANKTNELFKNTPFAKQSEKMMLAKIIEACKKYEKENDIGDPLEDLFGGESDGT